MNDYHLIVFDQVSFTYNEEDQESASFVLKDINLTVDQGEFVAILGHNGSGKSTLAKLSNSIYLPTKGKVTVSGMDTSAAENEFPIRKKVGVVFQNPDNQIVASIVEEDVAFGPENLGVPPKEIRRRVDDALKAVDMYDYRLHETHRLSGGQKQRVAIAGVMAMHPDIIIFDEATSMLDPQGKDRIKNLISELHEDRGLTILSITHDIEEVVKSDYVIAMNKGRVALTGTPEEVFAKPEELKKIHLELPFALRLQNQLRKEGLTVKPVITMEGLVEELCRLNSKR